MTSDFTGSAHSLFRALGPGSRIAGYLIEEQIGAGGMAVVFRARDEVLGRPAAVKVIAPSLADDEEFRARFLRESRAAAAVDSLHIIPVYGAGEAGGLLYIATRFAAGGDLAQLLRRSGGRLSAERAVSLVAQVASALDAAHAAGLVHRDVKPHNILVDAMPERREHAYLSDFGLSKGTSSTGLTASGEFLGTPDYCAPEQIRSAQVDGRADQYALGCVAFVLLTGTAPFHREETVGTLFAHLEGAVPSVAGLRPELPAAIDGVIARALAKSPEGRYGRCGEFAAALLEVLAPDHPAITVGRQPGLAGDDPPSVSRTQPRQEQPAVSLATSPPEPPAPFPEVELDAVTQLPMPQRAALQAADGLQTAQASVGVPAPSAHTTNSPAVNGEGAEYANTITSGRGNWGAAEGTPGQDRSRRRGRGKVFTIWAATGTATVLVAGVAAAAGFHLLLPRPGSPSRAPSRPAASQTSSQSAHSHTTTRSPASAASSHPNAGGVITPVLTGGKYGFNAPDSVASDGTHIWITNYSGDSVTELNSNGTWIRTLSGSKYGFNGPDSIATDGTHIWITNYSGDSVTELNSDGTWIRTLSGGSYGFNNPDSIATDGTHVWVANWNSGSLTELNASNGAWIQLVPNDGSDYNESNHPTRVASDGTHIWVANEADNENGSSVGELNAGNGAWIQTLSGSKYGFNQPQAIAFNGTHIWIANGSDSVTELNAGNGAWIQTLSGSKYGFNQPESIAFDGSHIWVANFAGNSVTELNSNGSWIRTMSGGNYGFNGPTAITSDGSHVWVANFTGDSVTELTSR